MCRACSDHSRSWHSSLAVGRVSYPQQRYEYRDMVSENRNCFESGKPSAIIQWRGDWESYKRRMKAAGILNGLQMALKKGEILASVREATEEKDKWSVDLIESSERLAAVLLLSLESTKGPQQSIIINRCSSEEENGVRMWADLIKHFEKGSVDIRKSDLQRDWETNVARLGEHPNELFGRLITINSKLKNLGAGYSEEQLQIRLVAAIEQESSGLYTSAIQQYRGALISGAGWDMAALLEFLTHIYDTSKRQVKREPELKGFIAREAYCDHCRRKGHSKNNCWSLDPNMRPVNNKPSSSPNRNGVKYFQCGEFGHIKRNCKKVGDKNIVATLNLNGNQDVIDCYMRTFVDSGSSCHTVTDLSFLDDKSVVKANKEVKSVDGIHSPLVGLAVARLLDRNLPLVHSTYLIMLACHLRLVL